MRNRWMLAAFALCVPGVGLGAQARQTGQAEAVARGKVVFDHWCAPCHAAGRGHPGTVSLQAKYGGAKPAELAQRTDLSPEIIHYFLRNGVSVMPFFRKTEISSRDEADLTSYITRGKK